MCLRLPSHQAADHRAKSRREVDGDKSPQVILHEHEVKIVLQAPNEKCLMNKNARLCRAEVKRAVSFPEKGHRAEVKWDIDQQELPQVILPPCEVWNCGNQSF